MAGGKRWAEWLCTVCRVRHCIPGGLGTEHGTEETPSATDFTTESLLRVADELELLTGSDSDHSSRHCKWPLLCADGLLAVVCIARGVEPRVAAPAKGIVPHWGAYQGRSPGVTSPTISGWEGNALQGKSLLEKPWLQIQAIRAVRHHQQSVTITSLRRASHSEHQGANMCLARHHHLII